MRNSAREALAREAADWHQRGIIGKELKALLDQRYDRRGAMLTTILKWLGLFAVACLGISIVAALGALFNSPFFGAAVSMVALGLWGRKLALDPLNSHSFTASILLTAAIIAAQGVIVLGYQIISGGHDIYSHDSFIVTSLFLTSALGLAVAYRYRLLWPLLIALLYLFHGIGSWHQYVGGGEYVFDIQDPRAMAVIALAVAIFGIYHERVLEETSLKTHTGFGRLYNIFGLLYFNASLLILSIFPGGLEWIFVFTAASIAQIVAGARLKDSRLTGYGVTFLSIDLYTRFFENFWDEMAAGLFLVVAGIIALALGAVFERALQNSKSVEASA